jgi:hypothetical protein
MDNINNDGNDNNQPPGATRPRSKRSRSSTRKTVEGEDDEDEDEGEESRGKRLRSDFDPSPSAEPAPSLTSGSSVEAVEEHWIGGPNAQISVEILKIPGLDPSEYHRVYGGQLTAISSYPISELESQDQRIALASNLRQRPIPDSQEQSSLELRTQQEGLPAAASPLPSVVEKSQSS